MKKQYDSPLLDIDIFRFEDVLTNSTIGPGEGEVDKPGMGDGDGSGFIITPPM